MNLKTQLQTIMKWRLKQWKYQTLTAGPTTKRVET